MKISAYLLLLILASSLGAAPSSETAPAFSEIAKQAGLDFHHFNGMAGKLYTAEVVGAGVALFDYDNDGDLDVYFGQGNRIGNDPEETLVFPEPADRPLTDRLFRNDLSTNADGSPSLRFVDVTKTAGLSATGYSMGVATGDFDRDGFVDLYLTNLGPNQLLRNRGDGTFEDVTHKAGVGDRRWSVPAVFFDYDGDGWLDLFVGNYHRFRAGGGKDCFLPNGAPDYCGPLAYPAESDRLLRNRGDGTFEDRTVAAGLSAVAAATALGAVAGDFDADGRVDLYVANDLAANHLWINQGDGTFQEDALLKGAAFDRNGKAQASMGVLTADLDGDGSLDLFMAHLLKEYNTLYLNDGKGMFSDRTREGGLVQSSWPMTGFGTVALDYDGDSLWDLFVANGAVHRIEQQVREGVSHPLKMHNQLYRGVGGGRFEEVAADARQDPVHLDVSRGLAVGDLDNDGDQDLVLTNNAGPARLLLNNRHPPPNTWFGARLIDKDGKTDAYGARARQATAASEGTSGGTSERSKASWRWVRTDGSFIAASDPRLLFTLGDALSRDPKRTQEATIEVIWPGGEREHFDAVAAGSYSSLTRGSGKKLASR